MYLHLVRLKYRSARTWDSARRQAQVPYAVKVVAGTSRPSRTVDEGADVAACAATWPRVDVTCAGGRKTQCRAF